MPSPRPQQHEITDVRVYTSRNSKSLLLRSTRESAQRNSLKPVKRPACGEEARAGKPQAEGVLFHNKPLGITLFLIV